MDDELAMVALCQPFGPLSAAQWHKVAAMLALAGRTAAWLLAASAEALLAAGVPPAQLAAVLSAREKDAAAIVGALAGRGVAVLTPAHPAYPRRLRLLGERCPPVLCVSQNYAALAQDAVAVTGARDAAQEYLDFAARLGRCCAAEGVAVASGGARGVDQSAMHAALKAGGRAVCVLPCGVLSREAQPWLARAGEALAVVSACPVAEGFTAARAHERNRMIYALGRAAVVVAARESGGTFSGAKQFVHAAAPLYVLNAPLPGNRALLALGARALPSGSVRALWENG